MLKILEPMKAIGLELISSELKIAEVSLKKGALQVERLFTLPLPLEEKNVKPLYISNAPLCTAIESQHVLIRQLQLPITKEKDLEGALNFQVEPLLPYPIDQAILNHQIIERQTDNTYLTVLCVKKEAIESHLEFYQANKIEPESVSCTQAALCQFGHHTISSEKPYLILHFNEKLITCVATKRGKLLAAYTLSEGLQLFKESIETLSNLNFALPEDKDIFIQNPKFNESFKRLQQSVTKLFYALNKDLQGEALEGILVTGEGLKWEGFAEAITKHLTLPLLHCQETADGVSSQQKQRYAVSIGLGLGWLKETRRPINFRQEDYSYPHPWKRLKIPVASYLILMTLLTITFYFFSQHYIQYKNDSLKQEYVNLLTSMNKDYDHFEQAFLAKHATARDKYNGEIVNAIELDHDDLMERLNFLQKDLQATPDSFPLFANIPRVSDVLGWLAQHPNVLYKDEKGLVESRLQIEHLNYTMLKRPVQGKKQEKYQVKVELEFSSPTPKWAREFHDALIAPNDLVDPKGEVKWSSNRGKYRTSFFLKDKTSYPNQ